VYESVVALNNFDKGHSSRSRKEHKPSGSGFTPLRSNPL